MNPRQIFHTFILISELILFVSIFVLSIIGFKNTPKGKEKVWICSKILTMNEILENNINNKFPLLNIQSESENNTLNFSYSDLLKNSTKNNCKIGYKHCGILDSVNNILCIEESLPCPINEIAIEKEDNYNRFYYKNYSLTYSNIAINKKLIISIIKSDIHPQYITTDNFIFDQKTLDEEKYSSGYSSGGGGGGGFRTLKDINSSYGDSKMTTYILDKFNEDNNIDKCYEKIYDKLYIRNYIGFDTYIQMKEFIDINFRSQIKGIFPNYASIVIGYISLGPILGLIIFSITRICYKDTPEKDFEGDPSCVWTCKIFLIISYFTFFLGFFTYIIYKSLSNINNKCDRLKAIKADYLVEDFINNYYCKKKDIERKALVVEIILFPISVLLFILGWIYHIYYSLCLKEAYKAKVLGIELDKSNHKLTKK